MLAKLTDTPENIEATTKTTDDTIDTLKSSTNELESAAKDLESKARDLASAAKDLESAIRLELNISKVDSRVRRMKGELQKKQRPEESGRVVKRVQERDRGQRLPLMVKHTLLPEETQKRILEEAKKRVASGDRTNLGLTPDTDRLSAARAVLESQRASSSLGEKERSSHHKL
ncbi:uncharacterized protein FMAN_10127 [Fusarium mangiferae]|uniref:Uncharacterized protein n=1 Tax=Fusarium mangiferae TaxID=192010 RepID=A0A1L7TSD0_FUSMA|nr:uncharacterized protein FMAN_10127 [Fusarium mangiferae]CVL00839.1 uncharacterized protein FMAN_10127 [Fusarium mangiferae]